jgi:hypothetical protein
MAESKCGITHYDRHIYVDPTENQELRKIWAEMIIEVRRSLKGQRTLGGYCRDRVEEIAKKLVPRLDHEYYELRYVHVWGHSLVGLTHIETGSKLYINTGLPPEGLWNDFYLLTQNSNHDLARDPMKVESIPLTTLDDVVNAKVLSLHEARQNTHYYPKSN